MFQLQLFFLLHCDEWDRLVALPRHNFVTGATLLQLRKIHALFVWSQGTSVFNVLVSIDQMYPNYSGSRDITELLKVMTPPTLYHNMAAHQKTKSLKITKSYGICRVTAKQHEHYLIWKLCHNKMRNKKYQTVETIPKSNIKMVESGKIDTPNTQIHDRSLSSFVTGTSIKTQIKH